MRLEFAPAAERDIETIGDYIAADNIAAARKFVKDLREKCRLLKLTPKGGRQRPELGFAIRSVPFRAYVVFYTLGPKHVRIERVIHGARDIEESFARKK